MPAKEITELRKSGKLEEALAMAQAELEAAPDNIWGKRNISWVYFEYLKKAIESGSYNDIMEWLDKIAELAMPETENMFWENIAFQVGKVGFMLSKSVPIDGNKSLNLINKVETFPFPKHGEGYSFLFKGCHKLLKETDHYLRFADWWGFESFLPKDFEKDTLPDGKQVMSIAEQAYIAYAKRLLPKSTPSGEILFDIAKATDFLDKLTRLAERRPDYQYPPYFQAKLLLAIGDKENILGALLPFARKKRNDFWVWEIIAEALSSDSEKVFACYCRALLCISPEEMLVSLRQKFARMLIRKQLYAEAKTEIARILEVKNQKGHKTSPELNSWVLESWYSATKQLKTNKELYKRYAPIADEILYQDTPEELVFVEFVNKDRKILNFIASESKFGYFKYERFLSDVNVGDVLLVRFQGGSNEGIHQILTATKSMNPEFQSEFLKERQGQVKIREGQSFGFLEDAFISPSIVSKSKLVDGSIFKGRVIKSYNKDKKQWGWKVVSGSVV